MNPWPLINAGSDATGDGIIYAANVSANLLGEVARRKGMSLCAAFAGKSMAQFFHGSQGYGVLLFTRTGTVETVSL